MLGAAGETDFFPPKSQRKSNGRCKIFIHRWHGNFRSTPSKFSRVGFVVLMSL